VITNVATHINTFMPKIIKFSNVYESAYNVDFKSVSKRAREAQSCNQWYIKWYIPRKYQIS